METCIFIQIFRKYGLKHKKNVLMLKEFNNEKNIAVLTSKA